MVCDFCSGPAPLELIECRAFEVKHVPDSRVAMKSDKGWMACAACRSLIEKGDRDALYKRTKDSWIDKYGVWDDRIDPYLAAFHQQFWENKDA